MTGLYVHCQGTTFLLCRTQNLKFPHGVCVINKWPQHLTGLAESCEKTGKVLEKFGKTQNVWLSPNCLTRLPACRRVTTRSSTRRSPKTRAAAPPPSGQSQSRVWRGSGMCAAEDGVNLLWRSVTSSLLLQMGTFHCQRWASSYVHCDENAPPDWCEPRATSDFWWNMKFVFFFLWRKKTGATRKLFVIRCSSILACSEGSFCKTNFLQVLLSEMIQNKREYEGEVCLRPVFGAQGPVSRLFIQTNWLDLNSKLFWVRKELWL